jgi:hydrogenase-4 component F
MGILVVAAALGRAGAFAAIFHVWGNSLTKGALFLSASNIRRAAGGRTTDQVGGMMHVTPLSAATFVTGMFAVTALPPFGPFFSELRVLRAALEAGRPLTLALFLVALLFAFFGLTRLVFAIVDGRPRTALRAPEAGSGDPRHGESPGVVAPAVLLLFLALWLGLFTPPLLTEAWSAAVQELYPAP